MKKYFVVFLLFLCKQSLSQGYNEFYNDLYKGGITGDGAEMSTFTDTCFFNLHITPSASIRKAYLFCYFQEEIVSKTIQFNGNNINVSSGDVIGIPHSLGITNTDINYYPIAIDVTNMITSSLNNYYLIPCENPLAVGDGGKLSGYYLLVLYENPSMPTININVFQNYQNASPIYNYYISSLNPLNLDYPIGLAARAGQMCNTTFDGSFVTINNNSIGIIGGIEQNSPGSCTGVIGSFYYENNLLFGLGNDTPDNLMNEVDGLANIQPYITDPTNFDVRFTYQSYIPGEVSQNTKSNIIYQLFLAYTTTCATFPVTVTPDTTICRNSPPLQLSATGGTQYLWQPATDLSCTTCPNPIFTGDSSRFYTVRIWNNDSCSVVRPVKVNVRSLPAFSSVKVSPSLCGGNNGYIVANSTLVGESYSISGGALQNIGSFSSLSPGIYTVTLHELNGCTKDSIVTIQANITTQANFTATPNAGGAPLTVYFNNQSTNATDYEWFLNNQSQGSTFSNDTFDTTGVYTVMLVAWQNNNPACADTFSVQIHVFDSLIVQIPNVFTQNHDGINEQFGFSSNIPVSVNYQLFNRWGNVVASGKDLTSTTTTGGNFTILWDGGDATEGTYFYKIEVKAVSGGAKEDLKFEGFFELVK